MNFVLILGRILFSAIFIMTAPQHFNHDLINYAATQGVPLAWFFVPLSGLMGLLGGFSILIGYKARWGAWLIALFLLVITVMIHRFWVLEDPAEVAMQRVMFLKNLSMMGGALLIAYFGTGPLSVDNEEE
jgi:putative oxidoreductase